jgi:hypothetical protein
MTSRPLGTSTSDVEVTHIDGHGLWLYVKGSEYFLPYDDYPWFKDATVRDILNVELLHEQHLHWPSLDVDLSVASLQDPAAYPLKYT